MKEKEYKYFMLQIQIQLLKQFLLFIYIKQKLKE